MTRSIRAWEGNEMAALLAESEGGSCRVCDGPLTWRGRGRKPVVCGPECRLEYLRMYSRDRRRRAYRWRRIVSFDIDTGRDTLECDHQLPRTSSSGRKWRHCFACS